jgi:hypothetical protein
MEDNIKVDVIYVYIIINIIIIIIDGAVLSP